MVSKLAKFWGDVTLYAIILSIGVFLSSCSLDKTTVEESNSLDKTTVEENDSSNETAVEEYLESKEISYKTEGMEYTETFKLVNVPDIPFITYIPEKDWSFKTKENTIALERKKYGGGGIEVVFLEKSINQQDAEVIIKEVVADKKLIEEDKELPSWAITYYSLLCFPNSSYLIFGEYENRFFYIYRYLDLEGAEEFVPVEHVIYREWIWKNADSPTDMMFFK